MITVVGMGRKQGDLTMDGLSAIKAADVVVVKSQLTHAAATVLEIRNDAVYCDSLYEQAEDFDHLNELIVDMLSSYADKNVVFCVVGAGAATHYDGELLTSILGKQGHTGKLKTVDSGGVAKLVLKGNSEEIEFLYRIEALKSIERNIILSHLRLHVLPGRVNALAPNVIHKVKSVIKQSGAKVGHTYFVGIGKKEGKTGVHLRFILHYLTVLTAHVSTGLEYLSQYGIKIHHDCIIPFG